jgi:outer membrane protein TolC
MKLAVGWLLALLATPTFAVAQGAYPSPSPSPSPTPERPKLELSLDEAVKRALENNADIAVARYNPEASAQSVREVEGNYDPFLSSNVSYTSSAARASDVFAGVSTIDTNALTYSAAASKLFTTGATLRVNFDNTRRDSNVTTSTFNPSYRSELTASLTQPLLRNFRTDATRQALQVSKKNREISDTQFKQTVLNTSATVRQLYYDLIYAIDNLEAQRKNLDLARQQVDENRIKVRVGTLAPLDVVSAEAEMASRQEGVILAEAALTDAEDAVKRVVFPTIDTATWALEIVPTDRATAATGPVAIDVDAAITSALENRTDMIAARKSVENAEISARFARNQTLPGADLVASYGATGLGGTELRRDPVTNEVTRLPGGYSDTLSQVFGRDAPTWSLGINLSYPLRNRSASAQSARLRIAREQAETNLKRLEMQVAAEVRSVARSVQTNYQRIESTRASRVLNERRLDAENKRFAAGMSTNYAVTQAQRDLALAEVAELRAVADYRKSLVAFELVQAAGSNGVSIVSTSTRSTTSRTSTGTPFAQ